MLGTLETIRPSSDLRNHYNEVSKQCKESGEIQIITVNGRGDTVLMAYEEYRILKAKIELYTELAESERDFSEGRVSKMDGTFDELRAMVKEHRI